MCVCIHVCIFLMKSLNNRTIALPIRLREKNRILYTPVRTGPVLISQQTVSKSCVLNTTNTKCSIIQQVYIICIIAGHHQRGSLFFFSIRDSGYQASIRYILLLGVHHWEGNMVTERRLLKLVPESGPCPFPSPAIGEVTWPHHKVAKVWPT